HAQSKRRDAAFVALNCGAIPENIIENELFGHQKGAFTGADRSKIGLFEEAHGGTLFLDEVNNASLALQVKLLRVLQDGTFYRLGDTKPRSVDVRVLAATNRVLPALVEKDLFREDLYYRLKVIEVSIPPLRERREDVPLLTNYFITRLARKIGKDVKGISTEILSVLMRYDWPGNVRELENLVQRMIILSDGDQINDRGVLPPEITNRSAHSVRALDFMEPKSLEEIEAYFIIKTLRETEGNRSLAAEILDIDKSTLWRKIKRYELE
ncbi:MAG TPA: sigma-54-dependent Fis family transcriptional regulator, partial [Chromatiales bacterium]|nr:sigma-54-dependent Fis family transcriptional regulator [Chromatiales bacterium]